MNGLIDLPVAAVQRLAFALLVSAGAHVAVLAHAPLAPGAGEAAHFSAQVSGFPLTARVALAPESTPDPGPPSRELTEAAPSPVPPRLPASPVSQAAALPSAEIYFRGSELDERATPLNEVNLVYPEEAIVKDQRGIVTLRLKIDHQGVLRDAQIVEALPPGVFDKAALDAVRELKFRPAMRNGVPVGSVKTIEVPFYPDCRQTSSCVGEAAKAAAAPR